MLATICSILISLPVASTSPQSEPSPPCAVHVTNGLGLDVYRRLVTAVPDANVCCSPLSIAMALSMLAEGAEGETLDELWRALHVPDGAELQDVHAAFAQLRERYRAGGGDTSPALAARIADLQERLDAANRDVVRLEGSDNRDALRNAVESAEGLARELNQLLPQVRRYELRVANALWVEQTFPLVAEFAAALDRSYGTGAAQRLDFRGDAEGARRRINGWVAERTGDRIRDLIPPGAVSPATALVLANAVWFRGEWEQPFRESSTEEQDFLLARGGRVKARLMRDRWRTSVRYAAFQGDGRPFATPQKVPAVPGMEMPETYPGEHGFTMVELPYKGSELAMVVIAPRSADGLPRLEAMLDAERLAGFCAALEQREVDTALPRFELAYRAELGAALQSLGVRRAFVPPGQRGAAQFAGISRSDDPREQVFLGAALHRTWIQVHEKGTEAAAATALLMRVGAAMPQVEMVPFVPVFRADRPFVFLIRDVKSGAVLFVGRVLDPRG